MPTPEEKKKNISIQLKRES